METFNTKSKDTKLFKQKAILIGIEFSSNYTQENYAQRLLNELNEFLSK